MNKDEELKFEEMERFLEANGFSYKGSGTWYDAVTSLTHRTSQAYAILRQRVDGTWTQDALGDYNIRIERNEKGLPVVIGKIVRCWPVKGWPEFKGQGKQRWMLLVNDRNYGFYYTCNEAKQRFDKDCMPKPETVDDPYGEYYCWHGDKPFGPGPYCTGCGGLIEKKTKK